MIIFRWPGQFGHKLGPAHVHGSVDLAGLRSRIVLEDFHHQGRIVRENDTRLQHAQKPGVPLGLTERSRGVDRLVAKGLVSRVESREDRRVRIVALSARGKDLIASAFRKHSLQMKRVFSELSPEELRGLEAALKKVGKRAAALMEES